MRKTAKIEIDGIKLSTVQLQPRRGMKLAARLLKYLAPVLGAMKPTDEVDVDTLGGALRNIMIDMTDDELDTVLQQSLCCTEAIVMNEKGEPDKYELHDPAQIDAAFEGKLPAMLKAVQWTLGVNYGDFFAESTPNTKAAKAT